MKFFKNKGFEQARKEMVKRQLRARGIGSERLLSVMEEIPRELFLPEDVRDDVQDIAHQAFRVLGCSGYGRVDFRLDHGGKAYCLEVNTLPGMTSSSLVPKAAEAAGISFGALIETICQLARK